MGAEPGPNSTPAWLATGESPVRIINNENLLTCVASGLGPRTCSIGKVQPKERS